jgi:peptide/nickel transport system substrate-binding protein
MPFQGGTFMAIGNFWDRFTEQRVSRRRAMQMAAVTGASVGAIAIVGCGGSDDNKGGNTPSSGKTPSGGGGNITRGGTVSGTLPLITGKDPHPAASFIPHAVGSYTYSRLMRFKTQEGVLPAEDRYRAVPELAQSFEHPDETTYIFTLNPDAKMHNVAPTNGRKVTAEDVVYSYQRYSQLSPNKANLNDVVDTVEPSTDGGKVTFKLKSSFGLFLERIASYQDLWIIPKELVDAKLTEETPVGSGPFIFDSFEPGVKIAWKKNPDYFEKGADGQPLPYVDAVQIVLIPDPAQVIAQFSAGNLDTISPSAQLVSTLPGSAIIDKAPRNILNFLYFEPGSYTSAKPPFNDDRVRRGISRAIDRDALLGIASPDGGKWANLPMTAGFSEAWWVDPSGSDLGDAANNYKFDVAEAKALFSAAGVTSINAPMHFSSNVYNIVVPYYDVVRQTLPNMLKEAGVTVNPVPEEYSSVYIPQTFAGQFDGMALGLESVFSDAGSYWTAMFYDRATGGIRNHSQVADATLNDRIKKMLELQDVDAIRAANKDLQKYTSEKLYYVPLITPIEYTARQPRLQGVVNTEGPTTYAVGTEGSLPVWIKA